MKTVEELYAELTQLGENMPAVRDPLFTDWLKSVRALRAEIHATKARNKQRNPV